MNKNIIDKIKETDISEFPDFHIYKETSEMALWVLWISKEKLDIKRLTAKEIALIIKDTQEVSVDARSIANSFNRLSGKKVHIYKENGSTAYEIMKEGKDYLKSKEEAIKVLYFEPGKKFQSKRLLSRNVLSSLIGELKIIDPYCDKKTLDILENSGKKDIKVLTKKINIGNERKQRSFSRELNDLNSEGYNIEFRDYPFNDIHDRYVISDNVFVVIGYSIKDFGKKETFITVFNDNKDIHEQLSKNFDIKWNQSQAI